MYAEEDLLPLSLLSQLVFCERRAALVYLEQLWDDNSLTAEGRILHGRAHEQGTEVRGDMRIARGLSLRSLRLGVSGKADVVEFRRITSPGLSSAPGASSAGVSLPGSEGRWHTLPVEYKRGRRRYEEGYEIQLCAQALCLEEMLGGEVSAGAIYFAETGRRLDVVFDTALRSAVGATAVRLHELVKQRATPSAHYEKKCDSCSLLDLCLPGAHRAQPRVQDYLERAFSIADRAGNG